MKKKVTITLLTGFIALILGLILCGVGYFMGGIEDIQAIATPSLTEETYKDIKEITIDSQTRTVQVDESPDDKFHVRYANFDNFRYRSLALKQDKQTLTIQGKDPKFHIQGIMQFLGQELAIHMRRNHELRELTILVPKEKTLETLSGWNYMDSLLLNKVHIKNLDWSGFVDAENVKLEGGLVRISSGRSISFQHSHLKNMTIDTPVAIQSYQTSTLENVTIQKADSIQLHDTTILGTAKMETAGPYHADINIRLSEKSQKDTQLDVIVSYDWEKLREVYHVPNAYAESEGSEAAKAQEEAFRKEHLTQMGIRLGNEYKNLKVEENKDGAKLIHSPKDAQNKLIIRTTNEQINLGSLESSQ
ncbi:DUF4097 family beta strand repeat protein [Streptococcus sp. zg-86]|uniref:DUF4097 family beta strand repeat protein n=1 Tax=Streptococcus zhangguiae TaxID=2664091 RepID=A0A6I4R6M2_9STRE|nr:MULTISPECIES: DUF4097 family beta strand repeat-containing protein [unclassified Streptococcus]MTB63586.1 DUF4097 family beta strand repeat protein [Streptococcus sp. zg-86]MTB89765.1 DUF4097 family beta strand repeat protein [Streptococcus sp. zg-36]MWV55436.1 DUF4097 family beta strand repeat protein [Streptococcus sp. zg-70]QTH47632.1 DUF4097 family beta strand repeat protein [Streptococcus sp. zg-86]